MKPLNRLISALFILCLLFTMPPLSVTANASDNGSRQMSFPLTEAEIETLAAGTAFDGREYGVSTEVHDQGSSNLCWAYAVTHASEASVSRAGLSAGKEPPRLSPAHVGYSRYARSIDPLYNNNSILEDGYQNWSSRAGHPSRAVPILSQWCGPVAEKDGSDANGWTKRLYLLTDALSFNGTNLNSEPNKRQEIKRAVVQYGAVTYGYNAWRDEQFYNPAGVSGSAPHACTIIGWDDSIPKESFKPTPATQDGGWLIKNSYSSHPYFYLTYDTNLDTMFALSYSSTDEYDCNYFYDSTAEDIAASAMYKVQSACNVYQAKGKAGDGQVEVLKAVNIGLAGEEIKLEIHVYTDVAPEAKPTGGTLAATQTATLSQGGFRLIPLDQPVVLEKGQYYAVEVTVLSDKNDYVLLAGHTPYGSTDMAYIKRSSGWEAIDRVEAAPRVKAFTKIVEKSEIPDPAPLPEQEIRFALDGPITKTYGDPAFSNAAVNHTPDGGELSYTSSNTGAAEVSSNGTVTITGAGTTTITATAAEVQGVGQQTSVSCTLQIEKKPVAVRIDDQAIMYGEAVPPFTVTIPEYGLAYEDTEEDLALSLTSSAGAAPSAGSYPISGNADAKNYAVTITPGVLTVRKGVQAPPPAPTLAGKTQNSVTLAKLPPNANGSAVEYSRNGSGAWQSSPVFSGLSPNTEYSFAARYAGSENYEASSASSALEVTTDKKPDCGETGEPPSVPPIIGGEDPEPPIEPPVSIDQFSDVPQDAWYYEAVKYAVSEKLFFGTGSSTFSPNAPMTRGMLVTVLYRAAEEPDCSTSGSFSDVTAGLYYTDAVEWAAENQIVSGYGNGKFGPNDSITREQLASILWRWAGKPTVSKTDSLAGFTDCNKISGYARTAMEWAVENGIVCGKGEGILDPLGKATRAEVAAMLRRYLESKR